MDGGAEQDNVKEQLAHREGEVESALVIELLNLVLKSPDHIL